MTTTKQLFVIATFFGLGVMPTAAIGQYVSRGAYGSRGGYGNRSSTVAEGFRRGQLDLARSQVLADYYRSQAADLFEQARSKYLDNRRKHLEYRRQFEKFKIEKRQLKRTENAKQREAREKANAEKKASPQNIDWPKQLRALRYAPHRQEIEALTQLYGKLQQNEGVRFGLRTSIKSLADRIKIDEKHDKLNSDDSQLVRSFVTRMYRATKDLPTN